MHVCIHVRVSQHLSLCVLSCVDDANLTPTEAMPPVAQSILEVKDIEEDRETFVMDLSDELQEPSDHEGREDVDGQIKAYVKFADSFPDIGWDEIEA